MKSHTRLYRIVSTLIGITIVCILILHTSCSSAPKDVEPETPAAVEASKFADFGNSFFNQARYTQAIEMYQLALDRYIRIDDQRGTVSAYNSLAKTYLAMGGTPEAEAMLQSALKALRSGGFIEQDDAGLRSAASETYNNYGELEYARGNYSDALDWFDEGLKMVSRDIDPDAYAVLLHNRGTVLYRRNQVEDARREFESSLAINREQENFYEIASNHYMLAVLDIRTGDIDKALVHAESALSYDRMTENSPGIGHDLFLLARIEDLRGNKDAAAGYLDRAESIFRTIGLSSAEESVKEYRKKRSE